MYVFSTNSQTNADRQLGVFLCMRCAALHRKLGTHISKVKSLSMDTWTSDQVDVRTIHLPVTQLTD